MTERETIGLDLEEGLCFECKTPLQPPRLYCCEECENKILAEMEQLKDKKENV